MRVGLVGVIDEDDLNEACASSLTTFMASIKFYSSILTRFIFSAPS